jgi:hypothetical protein
VSPLFPTIHGNVSYEVRVSATASGIAIKMEKVTPADCQLVASVEEAEDVLLAVGSVIDHEVDTDGKQVPEVFAGILIQAMRYGNTIASCSRRGSGNVILMGRDVYQKLEDAYTAIGSNGFQSVPQETVGRWEKKGVAIGGIAVYVGDAIPADEVFVAYVGPGTAIDGPGGLLKDGDDLYLRVLSNNATALGNVEDYIRRFRVTIK